jgi:hypothetical protein
MKALTWLVSLVASIAVLTGSAAAQCTRHFYNNSPVPFTFIAPNSAWCNGMPSLCTINPHTTSTLTYLPFPVGSVTIGSAYGSKSFLLRAALLQRLQCDVDIRFRWSAQDVSTAFGAVVEFYRSRPHAAPHQIAFLRSNFRRNLLFHLS